MSIVATSKRLAGSSCHLVRRYRPYPRPHCARWGTQLRLSEKGTQQPPTFQPMSIVAKRSPISATAELLCKVDTHGVFDHAIYLVVKNGPRHFGTWDGTVRHLGQDNSPLRSELSLGHFGTSVDLSGQFGPTRLMPKCPGSEMSWVQSIRNSVRVLTVH